MPSNEDNKQTEFKAKENSKETKKSAAKKDAAVAVKKPKHSLGWFIGVIILILISITFVLPVSLLGFTGGNALTFGTYNGKKISYEASNNNYFYSQYASLVQSASDTSSLQGVYQIWSQAFTNTVFFTAMDQMAQKAKIIAADSVVDQTIRKSFTNDDGEFDSEAYGALDTASRAAIKQQITQALPAQIVLSDMSTVLTSNAESEAIAEQGATGRTFKYAIIDATAYPVDEVTAYANANPQLFTSLEISMLTVATEEEAVAQLTAITAGEKDFYSAAQEVSLDGYKDVGGAVGQVYYYQLKEILKNEEDVNKLFSAKQGEIVGPFAMKQADAYSLFSITSEALLPEMNDDDILAVQAYLNSYDGERIATFTEAKANELFEMAQNASLETAAERLGLEIVEVAASTQNIGGSTLLTPLKYIDTTGGLATVSSNDSDYYASLYRSEEGTVLAPQKINNAYVVTEIGKDVDLSATTTFVKSYWPTIASNLIQNDLQNMIFGSDNFVNNFNEVFFSKVYSLGSNDK